MRVYGILLGTAAAVLANTADAQSRTRPPTRATPAPRVMIVGGTDSRAVLGITVSTSGNARDTLGLLINSVVVGGPADRAGIVEGSRLAEINGIRLRLYPGDVGHPDAAEMMMRRLTNELRRVRAGDEVTLRVYADGRFRTVTVPTGDAAAVASGRGRAAADDSERVTPREPEAPSVELRTEARARAAPPVRTPGPTSVEELIQAMGDLQSQVRRLLQDERSASFRRALDNAEQQIGELQRQLRDALAERERIAREEAARAEAARLEAERAEAARAEAARAEAEREAADRAEASRRSEEARPPRGDVRGEEGEWTGLAGLRVTRVSQELASYFGEGSDRGLLVLEADESWEPLRAGDVILRVNRVRITSADRLGNQLDPRSQNTVEVLRRGQTLTLTVGRRRR